MATVSVMTTSGFDMLGEDVYYYEPDFYTRTSTSFKTVWLNGNEYELLTGTGFSYNADGEPVGGTVTGYMYYYYGPVVEMTGLFVPMVIFESFAADGNDCGPMQNAFSGHDVFSGNQGDDVLVGFSGNDRLFGQDGGDILIGDSGIAGDSGSDTLFGQGGNDALIGGPGEDILNGGPGADSMFGENGSDVYYVDDIYDEVLEGFYYNSMDPENFFLYFDGYAAATGGNDVVCSYLSAYTLPDFIEYGRVLATGGASLTGNELVNVIYGGPGNDTLIGLGGGDVLFGDAGADTMIGGDGNDIYYVGDATDVVTETNATPGIGGYDVVCSYVADCTLPTNVEYGILLEGAWINNLSGNGLNNVMYGNGCNNLLAGENGIDVIVGLVRAMISSGLTLRPTMPRITTSCTTSTS